MTDIEVARAVVTIVPSMEGAQKSITEQLTGAAASSGADKAGEATGSKFGNGLKKGLVAAGAATAAVVGATVAAGKAFVGAAGDVAAYGDNIDKMSQKVGISAEAYQEWDFIAQHSGTSMESLKTSFKTMANAAQNGKEEFKALGISLKDAKSMSTEDLFAATIKGLQNMEEGTERTAIASALLGKGATELGALLNTSAADTEAMRQQVHDLGGVMSNEAVKDAAAYQDSLQNLQTGLDGVKNNLISQFLPGITTVMDGLTGIVSGDSEGGLAMIDQGIDDFVNNLTDLAPQMFEIGASILESFASAIIDNLPELMEAGLPIIMELVEAIIENLPALIEAAVKIVLMIAQSIGENLPELIPACVDAVLTIVDALIDNIDLLVDAAIAIIVGLAEGLINALPDLIERVPEIIIKLVEALIENAPKLLEAAVECIVTLTTGLFEALPDLIAKLPELIGEIVKGIIALAKDMAEAGKELVNGIWQGIKDNWDNIVKNVKDLGGKLVDSVKGFFKIGSPSKLFADEVGQWIPEGIAVGIEANSDSVSDSVDSMVKNAIDIPGLGSASEVSGAFTPATMGVITTGTNDDVSPLLGQYLPLILQAIQESGVKLSPDMQGLFTAMRDKNNDFRKANGVSAFA